MEASVHRTETTVVAMLLQFIVILAVRAAGPAAAAVRQPRVVGEIVGGAGCRPSQSRLKAFARLVPANTLHARWFVVPRDMERDGRRQGARLLAQ